MTFGVVILAHRHLHRTRQLAAALCGAGLRVVIHVDGTTPNAEFTTLKEGLKNKPVRFAPRIACDWGRFSLVRAGLGAAETLLAEWPDVSHVIQISGSCLPIRPIPELKAHLAAHPNTDFVESTSAYEPWVQGGLSEERFQYHFPFSWKRHRWAFDRAVEIQRALGVRRKVPEGIEPYLGSQWWCLSTRTLRAILEDPRRAEFDRFFKGAWIPDESYIPTLVRRHSTDHVSKSLTLARFDDQGKPHVFYDDHAELLAQSEQFFARKIWHGSHRLYRRFLHLQIERKTRPSEALHQVFDAARMRRCAGRPGLRNAGRFPARAHERQPSTVGPYTVLIGFGQVFDGFQHWLGNTTGTTAHGRVFQADRVVFSPRWRTPPAGITANPMIRDANPEQFVTNMLWAERKAPQSLLFEIADSARMAAFFARDPNARIIAVQGAWMLDLFQRQHDDPAVLRTQAKRLAAAWSDFGRELIAAGPAGRFGTVSLADLTKADGDALSTLQQQISPQVALRPKATPPRRSLDGFGAFVDRLHLMGIDTSTFSGKRPAKSVLTRIRARR